MIRRLSCTSKQANIFVSFLLCMVFTVISYGQSTSGLISQADKLFKEENYAEAMPLYSQLLSLHPRDPFYSYRFGVSMLYSDTRDPNSSIRYIESGLDKLDKDDAILIHFHLGTAYHYTFRFIEAIRSYTYFIQLSGNNKRFEKYDAHRRIHMCRNGVSLLQNIRDLYVLEKHHVSSDSYFRSYNIRDFGGTLIVKPAIFQSKQDKRLREHSLAFITKDSQTAYFSSYGEKGETGRDIYKSEKDKDGNWGKPVRLSNTINTPYDENYPFMLPDGKTLYFSSKGHNSMGGYDVFRSTWDSIKNDWTTPVNLDFAINTPFDDIMFVTDNEEQFAYFSSNRNSALLHINVFKVRIDVRPEELPQEEISIITDMGADINDKSYQTAIQIIQEKARLEVNTDDDDIKKREEERRKRLFADNYKYNIPENPSSDDIIAITFQHVTEIRNEVDMLRNMYATTAIASDNYIQKSNTLKKTVIEKEQQLNRTTNTDAKRKLESDIKELSNEAQRLQKLHAHGLETLKEIEKTVAKQTKQYNQVLFKAGEIQKTASGFQLDTSIIMLKDLINNIENYKLEIKTALDFTFPTDITLVDYDSQIAAIHTLIDDYQEEIVLIQNVNSALQVEITKISDSDNTSELTNKIQKNSERVQYINTEINALQAELQTLHEEKKQIEQILNADAYELIRNATELYDEMHQTFAEKTILKEVTIEEQQLSEPQQFLQEILAASSSSSSISQTTTEETVVQKQDDLQSQHETEIVRATETNINQQGTETEDFVAIGSKSETLEQITEQNNVYVISDSIIAYTSPELKKNIIEKIISSDVPAHEKTMNLHDFFTTEKKFIEQKNTALQTVLSEKIFEIETFEKNISEIDILLQNQSLHPYDRKRLETQWEVSMNLFQSALAEYTRLIEVEEVFKKEIQASEQVLADISHYYPIIEKAVHEDKQKRADNNFSKLSTLIRESTNDLFADNKTIEETLNKTIIQVNEQSAKFNLKITEFEKKKNDANTRLNEQKAKSEQNINERQQNKIISQINKLETELQQYLDTISHYQLMIQSNNKQIGFIRNITPQLLASHESIIHTAQLRTDQQMEVSPTPVQLLQKKQRIDFITQTIPLSSDFPKYIAELNQWKHIPEVSSDISEKDTPLTFQIFRTETDEIISEYIQEKPIHTLNETELQEKSDLSTLHILQVSAIAYLTKIQQLEKRIQDLNEPTLLYNSISELQILKNEYSELVLLHNRIAAQYENIPLIDEKQVVIVPEKRAVEYMQQVYAEQLLFNLNDSLTTLYHKFQIAEVDKKPIIQEQMYALEQQIETINFTILETEIISAKAEQLALKTVLNEFTNEQIPLEDRKTISELEKEISQLETRIETIKEQLSDLTSLNTKKPFMLEMYQYQQEISQKRNTIVDLYKNYVITDIRQFEHVYSQISKNVTEDKQYVAQILSTTTPSDKQTDIQTESEISSTLPEEETLALNAEQTQSSSIPVAILTISEDAIAVQTQPINISEANQTTSQDRQAEETPSNEISTTEVITPPIETTELQTNVFTEQTYKDEVVETKETISTPVEIEKTVQSEITPSETAETIIDISLSVNDIIEEQALKTEVTETVQSEITPSETVETIIDTSVSVNDIIEEQALKTEVTETVQARTLIDDSIATETPISIQPATQTETTLTQQTTASTEPREESPARVRVTPIISETTNVVIESNTNSPAYKAYYDSTNPIPEFKVSQGLIFKVQISASRTLFENDFFKGLSPISFEFSNNWYRYMVGEFSDLANAIASRNEIRPMGYPDAFVVAYYNGRRISIAEARTIAVEETDVASIDRVTVTPPTLTLQTGETVSTTDIIELTSLQGIIYTVQVGVFGSPRNSTQLFGYRPLIQDRMQNGNYRYMVGLYENYAQAIEVRNNIRRTNVPDAFVVVYRNGQRISNAEAQTYISEGEQPLVFETAQAVTVTAEPTAVSIRAEQIFFSIQLGAYSNQVPVEVVNSFIRISETGIDFFQNQEGFTIYTAGKFSTLDEATELRQRIQAGGLRDAFIIAVENGKKIPLQEAIRIKSNNQ